MSPSRTLVAVVAAGLLARGATRSSTTSWGRGGHSRGQGGRAVARLAVQAERRGQVRCCCRAPGRAQTVDRAPLAVHARITPRGGDGSSTLFGAVVAPGLPRQTTVLSGGYSGAYQGGNRSGYQGSYGGAYRGPIRAPIEAECGYGRYMADMDANCDYARIRRRISTLRPYYSFQPRFSVGFGLWVGFGRLSTPTIRPIRIQTLRIPLIQIPSSNPIHAPYSGGYPSGGSAYPTTGMWRMHARQDIQLRPIRPCMPAGVFHCRPSIDPSRRRQPNGGLSFGYANT